MLVSSYALKEAVGRYNRSNMRKKEGYSDIDSAGGGISAAFVSFGIVLAIIFFVAELVVLFYAINSAMVCSKSGPERIVNIVLATTFTIPYMMLNILFNQCTKDTLSATPYWLPTSNPA